MYFEVFPQTTLHGSLLFDLPKRRIKRLTLLRTIAIRLFHVLLGRLYFACQRGSITPLIQSQWDMIPFKIVAKNRIVGCCFLLKHNTRVWEIGIIGVLKTMRRQGIGSQTLEAVKRYTMKMGASRIIVRASGARRAAEFFVECGFKKGFSEQVFFIDISR